jgi:hypothetical protein
VKLAMTTTVLRTENAGVKIALLPIDELRPHEKGSPMYLELLSREIQRDGVLRYPVVADEKTRVILDGMHRWLVLKSLGYKHLPVMLVDAFMKPAIRVGRRRIHRYESDFSEISVEHVILTGLSGKLMQPRSTRHFFPFQKLQLINYPLNLIEKGAPSDVSPYLAKMTPEECNIAIRDWLEEISEELEFLNKRKTEVEREKEDFLKRVRSSENHSAITRSFWKQLSD